MGKKTKSGAPSSLIIDNRKARHDYTLERKFEAGLVLEGWEIKSIRAGRAQLKESYVILKDGEAWLLGAHISPLPTASTHITPDPVRTRKLLLHQKELGKLRAAVERDGLTIVPVNMHWSKNRAKLDIAIARGKKQHDKRDSAKKKQWDMDKARQFKQ